MKFSTAIALINLAMLVAALSFVFFLMSFVENAFGYECYTVSNGFSQHTAGSWNEDNYGGGYECVFRGEDFVYTFGEGNLINSVNKLTDYGNFNIEYLIYSGKKIGFRAGISLLAMDYVNYDNSSTFVIAPVPVASLDIGPITLHATYVPATIAGWKADFAYVQAAVKIITF